jgi:glyoxylase-like metal-dependent hydrolase (beta-lactamase superfamily II)
VGPALRFGQVEIHLLVDGRGRLPREAVFGDDFAGGEYVEDRPYNCLLVRGPSSCVLVDAGLGDSEHPLGGKGGRLRDELAAVDQRPEDVDVVVISHGHSDHIGGLVRDSRPAFPSARYVIADDEWTLWTSENHRAKFSELGAAAAREQLVPLEAHGVVERVDGESEVAPGVRVVPAPGHTHGQLAVEVDGALLFCVDAFLDRAQLERPELGHGLDEDPEGAEASLRALFQRASDRDLLVGASHLEEVFRIERSGSGFRAR